MIIRLQLLTHCLMAVKICLSLTVAIAYRHSDVVTAIRILLLSLIAEVEVLLLLQSQELGDEYQEEVGRSLLSIGSLCVLLAKLFTLKVERFK